MAIFGSFDFGKGLKKQAEAFSRAPTGSRARKLPQLLKQLDDYASKYLATVISHSAQVNPGQLRAGAEALVDVSTLLQESSAAYRVFSELASRSRKVAAVPQLGQLVDRLLELPTDQKKERSALLTYRIVTGTLGSERFLAYLRERAHLTEQTSDWKEYALGIARLIRDGVVQANEELVNETLQDLANNKQFLGDQAISIQQMLAESMMLRRNHRQAEFILVEAAVSSKDLPDSFYEAVETLLATRQEACWELHQLGLDRSLKLLEQGEVDWPTILQKLAGAKLHEPDLLSFLVEHPLTLTEGRLALYVRQNLSNLPPEQQVGLFNRLDQLAGSSGERGGLPDTVVVPPPPTLVRSLRDPQPLEYLEAAASGLVDAASLRRLLKENVDTIKLDLASARAILRQLANAGLPEWAPLEAQLWLVEQLTINAKERLAVQLLDDLLLQSSARELQMIRNRLSSEAIRSLLERLRKALGERSRSETWLRMVRLCLLVGDFRQAKEVLAQIAPADEQSKQAFAELEHWITRQAQPTPWMLMTLSEARRDCSDDLNAGFDVATQAALLAPNDESVQAAYREWSARVPATILHERRLRQAIYLLTREERLELWPVIFTELEAAQVGGIEILEWIDQVLPAVRDLRGVAKSKARQTILKLLAAADPIRLEQVYAELTADLDDLELQTLLTALLEFPGKAQSFLAAQSEAVNERIASRTRVRTESEIETSRHNGRPIRYSAGEMQPGQISATPAAASPWRRALAIARRKRVAGDIDGAIRDLHSAFELDPHEAELSIELAEAFADKGDYKIARKVFGDVIAALGDKGNVELRLQAMYGLASVIEHLDNPAEAVHCLEELLTIRHDYRDSRERLEALKQKLTFQSATASMAPSNIAANVILEGILELLNARAAQRAEVAD